MKKRKSLGVDNVPNEMFKQGEGETTKVVTVSAKSLVTQRTVLMKKKSLVLPLRQNRK